MPEKVSLHCRNINWKAKFNYAMSKFDGLETFMRYYDMTMYSMVKFDYYGEDLFRVKIFETHAVECHYPKNNVKEFINNQKTQQWMDEEYIVGRSTLEFEKFISLWRFNAKWNWGGDKKMVVSEGDIDPRNPIMVCFIAKQIVNISFSL